MNELNLTTPSLLFSAISLILLAYTNRFLSYASVVRSLNEKYQENPDKDPTTLNQIRNFVLRLRLIRWMQTLGAGSLVFCLASMFFYFINQRTPAEIIFGIGMIMLVASLCLCIWEIQISTEAISLHLQNIRRRQREQDPYVGNTLRRNANRREGETLGEQNTRKNQEKQRREKQEREERKARERAEQQAQAAEKTPKQPQSQQAPKPEEKKADNGNQQGGNNNNNNSKKGNNQRNQQNNKPQEVKTEQQSKTEPSPAVTAERPQPKQQQREPQRERSQQVKAEEVAHQPNQGQTNKAEKHNNQGQAQTNKAERHNRQDQPNNTSKEIRPQTTVLAEAQPNKEPKPQPQRVEKVVIPTISEQEVEKKVEPAQAPTTPVASTTIDFATTPVAEEKKVRKIFANRKPKTEEATEQPKEQKRSRYQERLMAQRNKETTDNTTPTAE